MKTILDLYCGTGGFSWGFHELGFKIKVAIDKWKIAIENYQENFPGPEVICEDILKLHPENFEKVDVIIGGPPCPQFSICGNVYQKSYPDLMLVAKFFEFVRILKPKFFIMENVPNILNYLRFEPHVILNSANYGVPQTRKRVFFGLDKEPPITHVPYNGSLDPTLKKWNPISDVLDLDDKNNGYKILYSRTLNNRAHQPFKTIHAPARTITTRAPRIVRHDEIMRDFTVREMALAQGFPTNFKFIAAKYNCFKMIGNAVSPMLSCHIAKLIKLKIKRGENKIENNS